jgi:hypothetical protein
MYSLIRNDTTAAFDVAVLPIVVGDAIAYTFVLSFRIGDKTATSSAAILIFTRVPTKRSNRITVSSAVRVIRALGDAGSGIRI